MENKQTPEQPKPVAIPKQQKTKHSQTVKNILISVLTTVLISATVYFLGFNKASGTSKAEKQRATIEGWKAYMVLENIIYKNSISLFIDQAQFDNYKEMFQEILNESAKLTSSIDQILTDKDIDKDLATLLKRRKENQVTSIPAAELVFKSLDKILDSAIAEEWDEQRMRERTAARLYQYGDENKRMSARIVNEIAELSKTLSRRYEYAFDMNDFYMVQVEKQPNNIFRILSESTTDSSAAMATREYMIGKWTPKFTNALVNIDENGNWESATKTAAGININQNGTWEIANKQLLMHYTYEMDSVTHQRAPAVWTFDISRVSNNSISLQMTTEPYNFIVWNRK